MPSPHTARTQAPPYDVAEAIAALSAADPKLARLIATVGPCTMRIAGKQPPFEALTESIIYQQVHGKAAAAIHAKLLRSFSDLAHKHFDKNSGFLIQDPREPVQHRHPTPQELLDAPNEQLRSAGLSANKALALRDLAAKTLDGTVPTMAKIRKMSDEAIIEHLTQVRGIGVWTVQMMLIFRLGRPNVFPTSDYGVRKGFALTFQGLKPATKVTPAHLPTPAQMERRAKKWAPWCSVASWYMWRACDLATIKNKPESLP
jgi:DNA-3-methyladenine glycosylase II